MWTDAHQIRGELKINENQFTQTFFKQLINHFLVISSFIVKPLIPLLPGPKNNKGNKNKIRTYVVLIISERKNKPSMVDSAVKTPKEKKKYRKIRITCFF